MKRLNYPKKLKDGSRESVVVTTKRGAELKVIIHLEEGWFKVIRCSNYEVVFEHSGVNNKNYLRRFVKLTLARLGVPFEYAPKNSPHFKEFMTELCKQGKNICKISKKKI